LSKRAKPIKLFGKYLTLKYDKDNPHIYTLILYRYEPIIPNILKREYNEAFKNKQVTILISEGLDTNEVYPHFDEIQETINKIKLKKAIERGEQKTL